MRRCAAIYVYLRLNQCRPPHVAAHPHSSSRSTTTTTTSVYQMSDLCPVYAPFFNAMGCTSAIASTCIGASYGTAKSGVGVAAMSVLRPDQMMKCVIPVVMAGIIAIYSLIISVLIASDLSVTMSLVQGFVQLGAGLSVGLAGLAAGFAIGIVGDAGVHGAAAEAVCQDDPHPHFRQSAGSVCYHPSHLHHAPCFSVFRFPFCHSPLWPQPRSDGPVYAPARGRPEAGGDDDGPFFAG
ncbi:hypothetical protein B0H14DRAFT_3867589 [Mycena olivaceomarginata]|nr:hypothetical protein B0H14DRAFT_3867589 [Mycena olivaceomarginata]